MKWIIVSGLLLASCGTDSGAGQLKIRVSGEDGAKTGFPVEDEGETLGFVEGWTMIFTKYLVSVGNLTVKSGSETAIASTDTWVADLSKGDPDLATFEALGARRWDSFTFELPPAKVGAKNANGVAQADIDRMIAGGFNYWIEGSATKNGATFTFAWGLQNPTRNAECTSGDGKQGIVITNNATAEAEITVHVEHSFWDSLGSEGASMRFDAMAAKANAQGVITLEALAGQSLAQPLDAGGQPIKDAENNNVSYNPGTVQLSENNLKGFVLASASSQGHLNGGGLCTVTALK